MLMDQELAAARSDQRARHLRPLADHVRVADNADELRYAMRGVEALMAQEVDGSWASDNLQRPTQSV